MNDQFEKIKKLLDALRVISSNCEKTAKCFPNAPGVLDHKQNALIANSAISIFNQYIK